MDSGSTEQAFFTLGWSYHVPSYNAAGGLSDEAVDVEFELGPGSVPTGELLWDPNADDINHYAIKMKAFISTSAQGPNTGGNRGAQGLDKQLKTTLGPMHGPQPGFAGGFAPGPQEQLLLSEKEKQIRELQQRLALQQQNEAEI
jgi:hypothetical protein